MNDKVIDYTAFDACKPSQAGKKDQVVVGPIQVLRSAAGFYVGRFCWTWSPEMGEWFAEPYNRVSEYFVTYEDAELFLNIIYKE